MKKIIILIAVVFGAYNYFGNNPDLISSLNSPVSLNSTASDQSLSDAYQHRRSDVQVRGGGAVIKLLSDDNEGSRHQKFILKLSGGQTLLVAHNIDLAPRINSLQKGDRVEFFGEYEWNSRGGVVHWTHHDPGGRHIDGWLKHKGRLYQ